MSERVRVLVELGGSVYAIGTVNASLAMRRAGDPRFRDLRPFHSVDEARRLCEGLASAKILTFPAGGSAAVDGALTKRRPGKRRRKPGQSARGSKPRAAAPAPAAAQVTSPSPAPPASVVMSPQSAKPSSRAAPFSASAKHRPSPETVARLDEAIEGITAPFR